MAGVTARTANWRLFGGSALVIAAVLWLLGYMTPALPLLVPFSFIVLAAGLVILAFGQSGGNGAVGKDVLGKVALVAYAAGWVILAVVRLGIAPTAFVTLAAILIVVAGPLSAWIIYKRRIAKGAAGWIMFLPTIVAAIWALASLAPSISLPALVVLLVPILFGVTGALYLLNDRRLG